MATAGIKGQDTGCLHEEVLLVDLVQHAEVLLERFRLW